MALAPGSRLGPYEILAPLGAGGMGEVYRARDARLGRDVAIKVLPSGFSADPDRLHRFEQEARATAALNHPNILAVYDTGTHDGAPYVVSELLEGSTLRERMSAGPLPAKKAVEIALDVARGLAAAHGKGIAHRDLKPENLFITRDGRIKILDFGLAKLTRPNEGQQSRSTAPTRAPDTDPGMIMGTAGYMAPEQVRGEPVDHRADLFALGTVLHEMLSGRKPFHRPTTVETMNAILHDDPPEFAPTPKPIPPALERITWHCLEKDPGKRFQSAQDVAFNLEALSGLSEPSSGIARPAPTRRGIPRAALLVITLTLLTLAAFAAGRALRGPSRHVAKYQQLTFRKGSIFSARFAPDGETYVYAASWDGAPLKLFMGRLGSPESREMGLTSTILYAISSKGEMAVSTNAQRQVALNMRGTLARVPLAGGAPREVAEGVLGADWSADGSDLAIATTDSTGVDRLEYPIGTVLFQTQGWLSYPRIAPDGSRVAFLFHPTKGDDRGSVMVVDRAKKTKTLSEGWSSESGLAWSPSGREVWFTATDGANDASLYAANLSGKVRIVTRVPGGVRLHDIARDGRVLLAAEQNGGDICALVEGDPHERNLSWLDFSVPSDLSPDGTKLLFTEEGQAAGGLYSVFMRGIDGSPAVRLGEGEAATFSPDGKQVLTLLYTTPPKLVLLPTGAGSPHELPNPGFEQYQERLSRWTPDGRSILFAGVEHGKAGRVYIQDVRSGAVRPVTPEGVMSFLLNPRGDSVYAGGLDGNAYAYPVQGGAPRKLSSEGLIPGETYLSFASDGRTVFTLQYGDRTAKLFKMDGITRRRTFVRELVPEDKSGLLGVRSPVVSADGRTIVFQARRYLARLYLAEGLR